MRSVVGFRSIRVVYRNVVMIDARSDMMRTRTLRKLRYLHRLRGVVTRLAFPYADRITGSPIRSRFDDGENAVTN